MRGTAERFYTRAHLAKQVSQSRPPRQVLEELANRGHRYFCVGEYLRSHRGLSAVELGFGSAEIARALADFVDTYRVVDIVARHGDVDLPPNVAFTQADLNEDFPFTDGEFGCTIAMMVVEHLFDPFHAFREIARVTRPGGKVFVNLPNVASIRCRLQLALGKVPATGQIGSDWFANEAWDGNHLHYFAVRETLRLAQWAGLNFDALHPVGNHLRLKRLAPALLCHEISFAFTKP